MSSVMNYVKWAQGFLYVSIGILKHDTDTFYVYCQPNFISTKVCIINIGKWTKLEIKIYTEVRQEAAEIKKKNVGERRMLHSNKTV